MWSRNIFVLLIFLIARINCEDVDGEVEDSYRLPNNSKPLKYDLWLKVNIEEGSSLFYGQVKIHVKMLESSNVITLHSHALIIKEINLMDINETLTHSALSFVYEESRDFLNITLPNEMTQGSEFVLDISYEGRMIKQQEVEAFFLVSKGFALGSYLNENYQTEHYIITTFEPTYARGCLPCFDEPGIRSIFSLKIEHDESFRALSNMPVISVNKANGSHVVTTFQDTPPMQTYLLAFSVNKFEYLQTNDLIVPQRIFMRSSLKNNKNIKFVLENLDRVVKAFEDEFDTPYTLPKLDHIIAPHFKSAIENWGLIGYSESYFQREENNEISSLRVFCHELGHNYFGNLVSPKWWDYIWLSEGLARFYETDIMRKVLPEESTKIDQLIYSSLRTAFWADRDTEQQPLNQEANNPGEITSKFSTITYNKGAAIVRMFIEVIGKEMWRKAMRKYFKIHKYSSVDVNDLYAALQDVIDEDLGGSLDIEKLMSTWVDQPNYPEVTVGKNGNKIKFQQNIIKEDEMTEYYTYAIPITYTTSNEVNFEDKNTKFWLTTESAEQIIDADWIVVNVQQIGFYVVKYDEELTYAIIEQFTTNHTVIHHFNRAWFLNSLYNRIDQNEISGHQVLKLFSYLKHEENALVVQAAFRLILALGRSVNEDSETFKNLQNYLKDTISKFYKDQRLKDKSIVQTAASEFEIEEYLTDHLNNLILDLEFIKKTPKKANIDRMINSCAAFKSANETIFDDFLDYVLSNQTHYMEKIDMFNSMGCTSNGDYYMKLLNVLLSTKFTEIEIQELAGIISNRLDSPTKIQIFLNFLKDNFDTLAERYPNILKEIITDVKGAMLSQKNCDELFVIQKKLNETLPNNCEPKSQRVNRYTKEVAEFFENGNTVN